MGLMKKYSQFLKELPSKTVVFAFGRFNPPTTGHELLVKAVKKLASANKADHAIYASKSQDAKKNPLTVDKKVHYLNLMFPNTHFVAATTDVPTFIQAAKQLNKKYKNIIMVAGSDRIPEYQRILNNYNGKEFHFDTIQVISAGERDPDADDASGMSASKMRTLATKGDYLQFKLGLPSTMRDIDGRRLMNDVRQGMGLDMVKEQINLVKDDLREQYFRGEIFNIGDLVESAGVQYEIVKRGSNHLLLKEESGKLVSKWIQDVTVLETKKEEETMNEELTSKTLKPSSDKIKVARIIATMLGVENAESVSNPEQLINAGLRKAKNKSLNAETLSIMDKMLALATEVGVNYDVSLKPQKLKEDNLDELNKSTIGSYIKKASQDMSYHANAAGFKAGATNPKYNTSDETKHEVKRAKGIERAVKKLTKEELEEGKDYSVTVTHYADGKHTDHEYAVKNANDRKHAKHIAMQKHGKKIGGLKQGEQYSSSNTQVRELTKEELDLYEALDMAALRKKLNNHTELAVKANRAGDDEAVKKHQVHINKIKDRMAKLVREEKKVCEQCGKSPCVCPKEDEKSLGAHNAKGFDPFVAEETECEHPMVDMSEYEKDYTNNVGESEEISDEELERMADEIDDIDDIIDLYDDDEFEIVDSDTGEEIERDDEEEKLHEEALMEVLSRLERMKAKVRIRRSKAKRERRMQIALKRYSDNKTINKRSRRLAIKLMKKRLLRGRDASKISVGEKERIERVIEKRKKIIGRLAMRLTPRVRKIEKARMSHAKYTQSPTSVV